MSNMSAIIDIEGVGEGYAAKLKDADVSSVEKLLDAGATAKGRAALAEKTGISEKLILKWVNHADLFRIKGVAGQFAELLEAAGVDTVPELAQRNAENLHQKLTEVNAAKNLTNALPNAAAVQKWIDEAKTLPRVVTH
jgi:predicted flap endonuclease-1-like 5' DNA nuclease